MLGYVFNMAVNVLVLVVANIFLFSSIIILAFLRKNEHFIVILFYNCLQVSGHYTSKGIYGYLQLGGCSSWRGLLN